MASSAPPASVATTAGAAVGAALALNVRVMLEGCGAGPAAMIGGLTAPVLVLALAPRARGAIAACALIGGAIFWSFEGLGALLAARIDARTAVIVLDLVALTALLSPIAGIGGRIGGYGRLVGSAVGVGVFFLPRELAVAVTVLGVLQAARLDCASVGTTPWRAARSGAAGMIVAVAAGGWAVARSPLDPTGAGWLALAAGLGLGSVLRGRAAGAVGILVTLATWSAWFAGPASIDAHLERFAGPVFAAALGIGGGALIAAVHPGRGFGVAALLAPVSAIWLLPLLPPSLITASTRSLTTFGDNALARSRTESLRSSSELVEVSLGPSGTTALWARDGGTFADLDGTAADPTSRAGDAESFAGLLGACLAPGRSRARVGGDDLTLVTRSLAAQGFVTVDVAVPDLTFARAQAERMPALTATWLRPSIHAVGVPAPLLLRLGRPADLVVEVARAGWSDGRGGIPDRRGFAAVRRTLLPQGVYVLALGTTRLASGDFGRIVDDLLATFPDVSVWSPPAGVDTAIFVAREAAAVVPWRALEQCVAADAAALRALGVRTALDVGGRLIAGRGALATIATPGRAPLTLPVVAEDPPLPLLAIEVGSFDPAGWFGTDAPAADLRARHTSQNAFFALLKDRDNGSIQQAITRARTLGAGNTQVVATLVRPHLERARAAMARAATEGIGSHAWQEAETALTNAELIAPGFADTACARGRFAEMKSDASQAEAAFKACVAADPENLVGLDGVARTARIRGDQAGAEAALRKAYAVAPERMSTAYNLGQLLFVSGQYDEAERLLKSASRAAATQAPIPATPNISLAYLYLTTRRPALALGEAERAKALDPGPEPRMLAGAARLEMNDLKGADAELRAALAIDPDYLPARGELGRVQARAGLYPLAAESFKAVLEREPGNLAARENLRAVQAQLGTPEPGSER